MSRVTAVLSTLFASSLFGAAQAAAPWPVRVTADLPEVPSTLIAWESPADAPVVSMEALQDSLGLVGVAAQEESFGGLEHLIGDGLHAYVYTWGGAAVHDLVLGGTESPIRALSDDALWSRSDDLLADLGLFDVDGVEIEPVGLGAHRVGRVDSQGRSSGPWTAHQVVAYTQIVDGYPTMGPGAEIRLVYGEDGQLTSFSHTVRALGDGVPLRLDAPEVALKRYLDRAGATGRWNLYKLATPGLTRVEITGVQLGYYAPSTLTEAPVLEPVYEIRGTVFGAKGALGELLWYEPAASGREISDLAVDSKRLR